VTGEPEISTTHLSDDDLFALSLPATGAPEPLPPHLSECLRCSRVVAEWKTALRALAEEDEGVLARRSPEEWRNAGDAALAAIRRSGPPGRSRTRTLVWALPLAASLLLVAMLAVRRPAAPVSLDDTAGLSAQDRSDDALLLDVERLASGDDPGNGLTDLAPDAEESPAVPAVEEGS
jgi:hypothetical protein